MVKKNKYPAVTTWPTEMLTKELYTTTTAQTDVLTPTSGKKIRVLGFSLVNTVTGALTTTVRTTLAFGTSPLVATKVLASAWDENTGHTNITSFGINVLGETDEVVQITNVTFSAGTTVTSAIVYYVEEN